MLRSNIKDKKSLEKSNSSTKSENTNSSEERVSSTLSEPTFNSFPSTMKLPTGRSKFLLPFKGGYGLSRKFKSPMLSPKPTPSLATAGTKVETITKSVSITTPETEKNIIEVESTSKSSPATTPLGRSKYLKPLKRGYGLSRNFKSPLLSRPVTIPTVDTKVETVMKPAYIAPKVKKTMVESPEKHSSEVFDEKIRIEALLKKSNCLTASCSPGNHQSPEELDSLIVSPVKTPLETASLENPGTPINRSKAGKNKKSKSIKKESSRNKQIVDNVPKKSINNLEDVHNVSKDTVNVDIPLFIINAPKDEDKPKKAASNEKQATILVKRKLICSDSDSDLEPLSKLKKENVIKPKKKFCRKTSSRLSLITTKSTQSNASDSDDSDDSSLNKPNKKIAKVLSSNELTVRLEKLPLQSQENFFENSQEKPMYIPCKEVEDDSFPVKCKSNKKIARVSNSPRELIVRLEKLPLQSQENTQEFEKMVLEDSEDDFLIKPAKKIVRVLSSNSSIGSIASQFDKLPLQSQENTSNTQEMSAKVPEDLLPAQEASEGSEDDFLIKPKKSARLLKKMPVLVSAHQEAPSGYKEMPELISQEIQLSSKENISNIEFQKDTVSSELIEDIEVIRKRAVLLDAEVKSLETYLDRLKHAKIFRSKQSVESIRNDEEMWKNGCKQALEDLLRKLQDTAPITMKQLMERLRVPPEILGYNELLECFE